ncbi:MAG: hypothetical protein AAFZ65_20500 [Planctomycetota bacterium]
MLLVFPGVMLVGSVGEVDDFGLAILLVAAGFVLLGLSAWIEVWGPPPPVDLEAEPSHILLAVSDPELAVEIAELNHGRVVTAPRGRRRGRPAQSC